MIILLGSGILGSQIKKVFEEDRQTVIQVTKKQLDLEKDTFETIHHKLWKIYRTYGSNYCKVLNAAAFTDVDASEKEKEKALATNTHGVYKLAVACYKLGFPLIHISSDYVFDGRLLHPYHEYYQTNPINYYGYTKLLAESMIQNSGCRYTIVRTGELYNNEKGFVPSILNMIKRKKTVKAISDQYITPTHSNAVSKQLLLMYKTGLEGIFHCTSEGQTTPLNLISYIVEKLNMDVYVDEISKFAFYTKASRPTMCVLENMNLNALSMNIMPNWKKHIDLYLEEVCVE
jgi:dTDP-4-dehydrorhamnose reductase